MATSIVPKSEIRKSENLIHGFAELPTVETEEGICWAMPGSGIICDPDAAREAAKQLDVIIQSNVARTGRSLL